MNQFALWLGSFLAPILTPIIKEAMRELLKEFKDSAEVSKPNEDLQHSWYQNHSGDGTGV